MTIAEDRARLIRHLEHMATCSDLECRICDSGPTLDATLLRAAAALAETAGLVEHHRLMRFASRHEV
jgi:hypothetical protein